MYILNMDTSLIIYLVLFLIVVVGIFMLIKKIIFAVFTVLVLSLIIVAGVGGLVYSDYKQISSQKNFSVNLFYGSYSNLEFGLSIPFQNKTVNIQEVRGFNSNVKSLNLENSKNFYIFLKKDAFYNLMNSNTNYYLIGTQNLNYLNFKINASITKLQVENLLNLSNSNALEKYSNILYLKNNLSRFGPLAKQSLLKTKIQSELSSKNVTFREVLFVSVLFQELKKSSTITKLFEDFQNSSLEVYPHRFSFKLLKILPFGIIKGFLPK